MERIAGNWPLLQQRPLGEGQSHPSWLSAALGCAQAWTLLAVPVHKPPHNLLTSHGHACQWLMPLPSECGLAEGVAGAQENFQAYTGSTSNLHTQRDRAPLSEGLVHLIDLQGELLGRQRLQAGSLCFAGGPDHVAVAIAHRQQRQGPRRQEALPGCVIVMLCPHGGHNPPLVVAP